MMRPWTDLALAPQKLWQSINQGWSFGNIIVNEQNSSAPQTEQAILARESYGRQIGKLLDAVNELVALQPDAGAGKAAFTEVKDLKARIDRVKTDVALQRIRQLRSDLDRLRRSDEAKDQEAYAAAMKALRTVLDAPPARR
ncbi:hypothetical protein NX02_28860 [Sphingomonas sanxanigenens DSM 19645 = NX02]|uniref:Uncharacterized protein n=2 Tax=Sphingomonas sanxanigenens TaxID=397260 RepID=W0AJM1_9SPHN|nr:hypothetical protein NX02_28860 [Sphingomonas sanxanigenens DSM 19645 = NX02]